MNITQILKGKKTYIVATLVGIVAVAQYVGFITNEVAMTLYGLLGASGIATMRAAVSKK